ncbi:MAG: hypothetical protein K2J67_06075 [Lachnospiraceae bacterium]|nr:hypothetical protein [Lachnospiraceae bacterium]
MRKGIYLTEDDVELLRQKKQELGLKSESAVISYLLHQTEQEKIAVAVRKELENNYLQKERIRWGVQTAEQNSIILLDAVNTLLTMMQADVCIPAEISPNKAVEQSQQRLKEKLAYFKQKKADRESKKG